MADLNRYLEAPVPGESPYVDVVTEAKAGTDDIFIHAGRLDDPVPNHWRLVAGAHICTLAAVAADRKFYEKLYRVSGPSAFQIWGLISSTALTSGQSGTCVYGQEESVVSFSGYAGLNVTQLIRLNGSPDQFLLKDRDYMQFVISNAQAGDTHYVVLTYKYLNYEMGITVKG